MSVQGNRQKQIQHIESYSNNLYTNLHPIWVEIKFLTVDVALDKNESLSNDAIENARMVESAKAKVDDILKTLEDKMDEKAIEEQKANFAKRASEHSKLGCFWFIASVLAFACIVIAFWYVIFESPKPPSSVSEAIVIVFRRVLMITAPLMLFRICLTKYNAERNLTIIYNHRTSVLNEFDEFMGHIAEEEKEARNAFRLEIAKYIFSDPQTGYLGKDSGSDINVNPVINMAERIAKSD